MSGAGMDTKALDEEADSGLLCLSLLARLHNLAADPKQLQHEFGATERPFDTREILRAAKFLGLKSRAVECAWPDLVAIHFPCIAKLDGSVFILIGGVKDDEILTKHPNVVQPATLSRVEFEGQWTGEIILATRRATLVGAFRQFDFSWFIPFIVKYKKYLSDVLIASFFLQLFALVTPLFFQVVVDKVLVHRGLTTLDVLAVGLLVLSLFEVALAGLRTYVFAHTSNRIDVALGTDLFKHLLHLPVAYFATRRVGDTVARVRELETIRSFITGSSITLVVDLLFTVIFFGVLYLYSPALTAIVAATLPLYFLLAMGITPILRARLHEKFNRGADNQAYLVEIVTGIETVKASALEPSTQRRWEERLAAYVAASFKATTLSNIANQAASLINKLMVLGILWLGARLVINGELSVGQLVAFNMIAARISGPILRLVQLWQDFQQAGISVQRLGDILNAQTEPAHSASRGSLPDLEGRVTFDHVSFRYQTNAPEVLKDISLDIRAGEVIGIVGRSGSGKSTLTKLVQRLYVPESGRILVDGVDLSMVDTAWLRRSIGVVLQENVLFNRNVRENIAISDPAMSMQRVVHAAKMAGAHEFILELAEAYDTMVGEHGSNFSGGQRQRIAIARALVTDPKILIFDEATSALDYESEAIIQQNMRYICKGRTVFIITHRLSSVRNADRIIVIDNGRVVETGVHKELVERGGYYARLHQHQLSTAPG
ncbi:MAG: subfamily B ATP-binding cassette protein HlyB/CyaB [Gammaproteobacteria bacterium]|jgi:subfamily B ATP-binding cassette protein HlyB/CyaB